MSAARANNGHNGADLHVLEYPLGIGDPHADTSMRDGGDPERGVKRNVSVLGDLIWDAVEPDVVTLTAFGKASHELHSFIWGWSKKSLSRLGEHFEGADRSLVFCAC